MKNRKLSSLRLSATRLCGMFLVLALVFGMCGVFAAPVEAAAGGMTEDPQYIDPSITTTIRNITEDEKIKYVLAFTNGNADRVDGTNSVEGYRGSLDASTPVMLKTLSASGYPQLAKNDRGENVATMVSKYGSNTLEPIFNDASKTYTAANSPFNYTESTQNYSLNSARNHVYFDTSSKKFTIYNEPLRPYNITTSYGYDTFGAFLPFNSTDGTIKITDASGNKLSDVPDDVSYNAEASHAANLHVTPKSGSNMADNWFVMKVEFSFYIPKDGQINGEDMIFEFSGDDDVWVYVDDVLVVDQGGTHKHTQSSINFATGKVEYQHYYAEGQTKPTDENSRNFKDWPWPWTETTIKDCFKAAATETGDSSYSAASNFKGNALADFTVHTLTFFFMERGGEASNCKLDFNLPIVPKGALSVQKSLEGIVTAEAENKDYTFILRDENGTALTETDFTVMKTDGSTRKGNTGDDGSFVLKANERAIFETIEGGQNYSVLQLTEKNDETYAAYSKDTDCTINGKDSGEKNDDGYNTGLFEVKYDTENQTDIVFVNKMWQDKELTVTKEIGDYISADEYFSFNAKVEGIADSIAFRLKGGESYTITDIPAGAKVIITEETDIDGMETSSELSRSDITGDKKITVPNVTTKDGEVIFLNEMKLFDITVKKTIDGSLGNKAKEFDFTVAVSFEEYSDEIIKTHEFKLSDNGTWTLKGIPYGALINIEEDPADYIATVTCGNDSAEDEEYEISKLTADAEVTFENVKDGSPNTGVSLDSIPYIMILGLTLAGAAMFVIRRRRAEFDR